MAIRKNYENLSVIWTQYQGDAKRAAAVAKEVAALKAEFDALEAKALKEIAADRFETAKKLVGLASDVKTKLDARDKVREELAKALGLRQAAALKFATAIKDELVNRVRDEKAHVDKHKARITAAEARIEKAVRAAVANAEAKADADVKKAQDEWDAEWGPTIKKGGTADTDRPSAKVIDKAAIVVAARAKLKQTDEEKAKVKAAQQRIAHYEKLMAAKQARYQSIADAVRQITSALAG